MFPGADYNAYDNFLSQVQNAALVQFGGDKIKERQRLLGAIKNSNFTGGRRHKWQGGARKVERGGGWR